VKKIRLIMWVVTAVAAMAAISGFALPQREAAARTPDLATPDLAHVNWGDVTIPGKLCKVNGPIRLHNGIATVEHSGFGRPVQAYTTLVTHGFLRRGLPVTTLQIFCAVPNGTAASQLSEGVMVFDSPGGRAHWLGTLTPQYLPNPTSHIPYVAVAHIDTTGHITTTEYWYTLSNADCCPSGRATTIWRWTGRTFIPGRTKITAR
jgi:hypothetical protein